MKEPFGKPGLPPSWSRASKHGIGTSFEKDSKVWFTVADGVITEVFYPSVDVANTRDIQFLVTDGRTFFDEEKKDTVFSLEYISPRALAYRMTNTAKNGRYRIIKNIVTDPRRHSLVMKVSFEALKGLISDYRLYLLFAPHIKNMGHGNSGRVGSYRDSDFLIAWREDIYAAITADVPFGKMSVGYSGFSDGWQDLRQNLEMDWTFERAEDGNIALMACLDLTEKTQFTVVLSFGRSETEAMMEAVSTMKKGYPAIEKEYIGGWERYHAGLRDLSPGSFDNGRLYRVSAMVLKAHEDKTHRGIIASLSIPWGDARGDGEAGGYHLIWARDLVKAAFAFMAMGAVDTAAGILRFLAGTQRPDGSWPQNMWLNGSPYWHGVQLDEVAFPVMLAWRLKKMGALKEDFYLMVKKAAEYIVKEGPVTEQDRWEENSGFSPSTLAAEITALVCAAEWAKEEGDELEAKFLLETADYWAGSVEDWTFSECDCISKDDTGHFLRIVSKPPDELSRKDEVCHMEVFIQPAGTVHHQGQVIDAGFLELVRYGVRDPEDGHITKSLKLVDGLLRKEMPYGPLFYRYNGDGYGEKEDGSSFEGNGVGRLWPLLSGERGMYEALKGSDPDPYIKAMEGAANEGDLIPEQIWDADDIPEKKLFRGKGTGSATPLMWAHSEYIKLLRTKTDLAGCDMIPEVRKRYVELKTTLRMTAWKKNKQIRFAFASYVIRIISDAPCVIKWTTDGWKTKNEARLTDVGFGLYSFDFNPDSFGPATVLTFTFQYDGGRIEGADYAISIV